MPRRNEADAREALRRLGILMERLGLRLHASKTRLVNLQEGQEGFDFLGFHHRKVKSLRRGRCFLLRWPGRKAFSAIRQKIRTITGNRRHLVLSLKETIAGVNPVRLAEPRSVEREF